VSSELVIVGSGILLYVLVPGARRILNCFDGLVVEKGSLSAGGLTCKPNVNTCDTRILTVCCCLIRFDTGNSGVTELYAQLYTVHVLHCTQLIFWAG